MALYLDKIIHNDHIDMSQVFLIYKSILYNTDRYSYYKADLYVYTVEYLNLHQKILVSHKLGSYISIRFHSNMPTHFLQIFHKDRPLNCMIIQKEV